VITDEPNFGRNCVKELPLSELLEKLAEYDELTILELLEIDSHKLVKALMNEIEEKYDELLHKLPDEDEDE